MITRSSQYPLRRLAENLLAFADRAQVSEKPGMEGVSDSPADAVRCHIGARVGDGTWKPKGEVDALSVYRAVQELTHRPETLILIIDQGEEVFRGETDPWEAAAKAYFDFLHLLCVRPLAVRVCISMRSEYKARFDDQLLQRGFSPDRLTGYYLAPLNEDALVEAILHPTKKEIVREGYGSPWEEYRFEYAPHLPEEIASIVAEPRETRMGKRVLLGGVLPTIQVICDRLWNQIRGVTGPAEARTITREHFLALGDPTDQILWHLEESLYEVLRCSDTRTAGSTATVVHRTGESAPLEGAGSSGSDRDGCGDSTDGRGRDESAQIDCWLSAMYELVESAPDGRVATKMVSREHFLDLVERHSREELINEDERLSRKSADKVVDHLLDRREYVLQHVATDSGKRLVLVHDAIGLVLARWKNEYEVLKPSRDVERTNPVLAGARFGREELYDIVSPPLTLLSTIDDQIWDHLLAIYANRRGFLARLGFRLAVQEVFPCPKPPEDEQYKRHLSGTSATRPRLVVLPPSVFPYLGPDEWQAIGISGVYRGWALIGHRKGSLPDLKGEVDVEKRRVNLSLLVRGLRNSTPRVSALDERGARFYQALGEVDSSREPLPKPTILGSTSDRSDSLYLALVNNEADFVVGSAPTRALCEQAPAFKVYVDYVDLEEIVPTGASAIISRPPMHGVWLVDRGLDEATLLRLASVLYYTVDYIRNNPEDFIRFLYDKAREGNAPSRT